MKKKSTKFFYRKMRLFVCMTILHFLSISVMASAQNISLNVRNASLKEVIEVIKKQTGYRFIYNNESIEDVGKISVNINTSDINDAMNIFLKGTNLGFRISDDNIVIVDRTALNKDIVWKIGGRVIDDENMPVVGATVFFREINKGMITDHNGYFTLDVKPLKRLTIEISFVGKKKEKIILDNLTNEPKPLLVKLKKENSQLSEVVVTGLFNRRKEGFTGSTIVIKGEDLKAISTTNIAKALSTIDPGFRIMDDIMSGSNPNRLPDLRMRGQASLPGGTTESSVDAVTLQGEYSTYPNRPLLIMDGFEVSLQTFVDLDPDRVENITILKDAAATSIYGSKAANGVIVIETKTPKAGRLWVSYSGNFRLESPDLSDYNLMNATEKLEAEKLAGFYSSTENTNNLELYQNKLREIKRGVNTYWLDKPLRLALQQRHSISIEGGDRALRYKLYTGINHSPGVMKGSSRDVVTGALDLQYRFEKVLMKNSVTIENSKANESPWGSFSLYTRLNPYLRPYGVNGEVTKMLDTFDGSIRGGVSDISYPNPIYNTLFNSKNQKNNFTVRNSFSIEYNPNSALRFNGRFSLSKSSGSSDIFKSAYHTDFDKESDPTKKGSYRKIQYGDFAYSLDLTSSYNKIFDFDHYVTANIGFNLQENTMSNYGAFVKGFPNENMDDILFGHRYDEKMTGTDNTTRSLGIYANLGYAYMYKYSFDFNIRLDGSSQFGENNRFAPFWSTGFKWDIKKENFVNNIDFISDLVFRTSYGITGSQGFAPYQSLELYTYNDMLKPYRGSSGTGVRLVAMPNKDLKWQQTNNWNIALEMGFMQGRITSRLEYYHKITKNQLTDITSAPSIGFSSYPDNLGRISNKGMEIYLSFIPYKNEATQTYWVVNLNGSYNKNRMEKISESLKAMNDLNLSRVDDSPLPRYIEGMSMTKIWVVKSYGIDPSTGDEIFMKRNGEMTGEWNAVDMIPYGDTEPRLQGSISSSFSHKGFGINLNFRYNFGGQTYNETLVQKVENSDLIYNADRRVLDLRWKKVWDKSQYTRISSGARGSSVRASSRFVMDNNTFAMGTLSLTYRMDENNSKYMKKFGLTSAKFAFNMEDLFYLSSVKRERGLDYPFARQFSLSIGVSF